VMIPGFTAEASLDRTPRIFRAVAHYAKVDTGLQPAFCSQECLDNCLDDCSDCADDGPGCYHACARNNARCLANCCRS